jgi:hypothetical protein
MARHERVGGTASPQALVVSSTRPGELIISRGDHPVIRLGGGEVVSPLRSVLYRGPVAQFFVDASDELLEEAVRRAGVPRPERDDGLEFAHLDFIESILLYTAELQHGGALLFVPEDTADDDSRLLEERFAAYKGKELADSAAHDLLVQALDARVLPVTHLPNVLREWREPRHSEFRAGKTAWRLFNAFTEALKGNLDALPRRTQALHGLLDGACGLAVSRN